MNYTNIEWTHFTSNPLRYLDPEGHIIHACIHASEECIHCYSEAIAPRYGRSGRAFTAENMKRLTPFLDEKELHHILTYKPASGKMCFMFDMTDIFGEWVPNALIDRMFAVFALRPDVTFQVLTKRAERMHEYLNAPVRYASVLQWMRSVRGVVSIQWPLPNVWLGVSAGSQKWADIRIPLLLQTPAAKRFVSYEPALGPVDFAHINHRRDIGPAEFVCGINSLSGKWFDGWDAGHETKLDWVVVGGESGPGARPFNVQWARDVVRQCKAAEVACFVKQMGSKPQARNDQIADVWQYADGSDMDTFEGPDHPQYQYQGGLVTLRLKDRKGGSMDEWPADLRVREYPR